MSSNKSRKRKTRSSVKNPQELAQDKLIEISNFTPQDDTNDASQILIAQPSYVEPIPSKSQKLKRTNFVSRHQTPKKVYKSLGLKDYHSARLDSPLKQETCTRLTRKIGEHIYNTIQSNSVFVGFCKEQQRNIPEEARKNHQMLMINQKRMQTVPAVRFVSERRGRILANSNENPQIRGTEKFVVRTQRGHLLPKAGGQLSLKDRIRQDLFKGLIDHLKPQG